MKMKDKIFLFPDDMILYIRDLTDFTKNLLMMANTFINVSGYKTVSSFAGDKPNQETEDRYLESLLSVVSLLK